MFSFCLTEQQATKMLLILTLKISKQITKMEVRKNKTDFINMGFS
jgi:hypothetical protein